MGAREGQLSYQHQNFGLDSCSYWTMWFEDHNRVPCTRSIGDLMCSARLLNQKTSSLQVAGSRESEGDCVKLLSSSPLQFRLQNAVGAFECRG